MNAKSLRLLRIVALIMGWLLFASVLAGIWNRIVLYCQGQSDPTGFFGSMAARFDILSSLSSYFSGFGNACFAFLIAAVFRMIAKQAPVGNENARRLMIVCCLSYVADALMRLCSFFWNLSTVLRWRMSSDWRFLLPYSATAIAELIPILYAAAIFVLYTHFTKMVTFESEVA